MAVAETAMISGARYGAAMGLRLMLFESFKRQDNQSQRTGKYRALLCGAGAELAVRCVFFPLRPQSTLIATPWFTYVPVGACRLALYEYLFSQSILRNFDAPVTPTLVAATGGAALWAGCASQAMSFVLCWPLLYVHSWSVHFGPFAHNHVARSTPLATRVKASAVWVYMCLCFKNLFCTDESAAADIQSRVLSGVGRVAVCL